MKIFLILPYQGEYEDIYESVRLACSINGHSIVRAEDFNMEHDIVEKVTEAIQNADIIIAEISQYAENKNVTSEFFTARASNKPIVPLCIKGEPIPFDIAQYQVIVYERFRLQETLVKPLLSYLGHSDPVKFLLKKTIETKSSKPSKVIFVSYSHIDIVYLDRLKIHLKPFEKKGQIDLWEDTKIKAGEKWKEKIASALDKSIIAILLISADFLASDFIIDNELPPLLKAAEEKGKVILPLIVKPCRFTRDENLSKFQALNDPLNPLSKLNENDREEVYVRVADYIDNLVK